MGAGAGRESTDLVGRTYNAAFMAVNFYDELRWADLMLDWLQRGSPKI
jgi:hypothetical protein